jgi:hypothetical protein
MLRAMTTRAYACLMGLFLFSPLFPLSAQAQPLRVDASAERMRVDGSLSEWKGARFVTLGSTPSSSLGYAFANADGGLYVGAEVNDDRLVRTGTPGPGQDALVLTLAMITRGTTLTTTEVWLHPGEPGESKAIAAIGGKGAKLSPSSAVKIVEGPNKSGAGYVIEAFIPWKAIPGGEIWDGGRGALRFEDVDGSSSTVESTVKAGKPEQLPRLIVGEGNQDFFGAFAREKNLVGLEPRYDFRGQVYGDKRPERVVLIDRYMVVYGPGYKDGKSYGFLQLPLGLSGGLKSAELRDLTGDGIEELIVVCRQKNDLGVREVWQAFALDVANPISMFGFELRKETRSGFVEAKLALEQDRGATTFVVSRGKASGLDAQSFQESSATDIEPILPPWLDVTSRRYRYQKGKLIKVDEQRDWTKADAKPGASKASQAAAPVQEEMIAPTLEAVLDLFKEQRGVAKQAKPSRHLHGNLLGKSSEEDLFVFGNTLVIVGPEVGSGGGYIAYGLPVASEGDLRHVGLADVTGDKRAEIFVRVRQALSGAEGAARGMMLVHQVDEQGRVTRLLTAEVFRYQGQKRIVNKVSTDGGSLTISAGDAIGWNANDYPFTNDETAGSARLLLPWKDRAKRYKFARGALVAE